MRRLTALLLALTLGLAVGLAACSSGGDDGSGDDPTEDTKKSTGDDDGEDTEDGEDTGAGEDTGDDGGDTGEGGDGGDGGDTGDGGDGGDKSPVSGDEQAYIDAMLASFDDEDDLPLDRSQAECMSAGYLDVIGVDRLKAAGISPEDFADDDDALDGIEFTEEDGQRIYDVFGTCKIDLREMMMTSMAEDDDISPEQAACFDTVLTDEYLERLIVGGMVLGDGGSDDAESLELAGPLMACAFMGMEDIGGLDGADLDDLDG